MTRRCKVCGKSLLPSKYTSGLCREHQFEEGDVWVLEYNFDADFYNWRPKFPIKTVRNGKNHKKKEK